MRIFKSKNLDDLILGIKVVLSSNRYSLSEDDRVLLNDCLEYLQRIRDGNNHSIANYARIIIMVVQILIRVFIMDDKLKDLF